MIEGAHAPLDHLPRLTLGTVVLARWRWKVLPGAGCRRSGITLCLGKLNLAVGEEPGVIALQTIVCIIRGQRLHKGVQSTLVFREISILNAALDIEPMSVLRECGPCRGRQGQCHGDSDQADQ